MTTGALLVSDGQKSRVISKSSLCTVRHDDADTIAPFDDHFSSIFSEFHEFYDISQNFLI